MIADYMDKIKADWAYAEVVVQKLSMYAEH